LKTIIDVIRSIKDMINRNQFLYKKEANE